MNVSEKIGAKLRTWRGPNTNSWSQCGEDRIADFYLEACGIKVGTFLDIGANHPTEFNNTYFFYKKGWSGFNVDPLENSIRAFDQKRPKDTNILAGIGDATSVREFYCMQPSTLSTFHKEVADSYRKLGHQLLATKEVPFLSVPDLIARHRVPMHLDLLSIDIEGGELQVIQNLTKAGIRPKVMICETINYMLDIRATRKNNELIQSVRDEGFIVYADTFVNTVFIDRGFWETGKGNP